MGPKSAGWNFCCPGRNEDCIKQLRKMAKKWMRSDKKEKWSTQLPSVVAMTGGLIVIAIVLRSLYLMFIKQDTT